MTNNIAYQCTQKQVEDGFSTKIALRFVDPDFFIKNYTYLQLHHESNCFANFLTNLKLKSSDIVFTFLPKCYEQFIAFLGTLKTGRIIGTMFSTFGEEALLDRLLDSKAKCIVTKKSLYKKIQKIESRLPDLHKIILIDIEEDISEKILSWKKLIKNCNENYTIPSTQPSTPSVLHYTSGSTGKPKGVLHHHLSLNTQLQSAQEILQLNQNTIYWCTADQGWVTGTSYGIIVPLSLGLTSVHYMGGFNAEAWLKVLQDYKVNTLYTAPTALRMLMHEKDNFFFKFNLSSLKAIFSVGEPLNPEIYAWGKRVLGKEIYDTWFQTETGSIMIANRPGLVIKPGSMGLPLNVINAKILDDKGIECQVNNRGNLCLKSPWDSMFIDYLYHHDVYLGKFRNGWYYTGDTAYRDQEGYFWFTGRSDDVINTSGHLLSPFEVESALLEIHEITESGVISVPDPILFEKVVAFISLREGSAFSPELDLRIRVHVANKIATYAIPQEIKVIGTIPKNKSGKIMRRVLKSLYLGEEPGDTSTLED